MTTKKTEMFTEGVFLKHLEPTTVLDKFNTGSFGTRLRHERIASGEYTHRTVYDEEYYEGDWSPASVADWLHKYRLEFDDRGWKVDTGHDGELYVYREYEVPYTEEDIQAAKDYVAKHGESLSTYIKFAMPVYNRDGTPNLPRDEDGE